MLTNKHVLYKRLRELGFSQKNAKKCVKQISSDTGINVLDVYNVLCASNLSHLFVNPCDFIHNFLKEKLSDPVFPEAFFKRSHYEKAFCEKVGASCTASKKGDGRYWDCVIADINVELKKSSSASRFISNEVRHSEQSLARQGVYYHHRYFEQATAYVVMLFISMRKNMLYSIHIVDCDVYNESLDLDYQNHARHSIDREKRLKSHKHSRDLNSQQLFSIALLDDIKHSVLHFNLDFFKRSSTKKSKLKCKSVDNPYYQTILKQAELLVDDCNIFSAKDINDKISIIKAHHPGILNGKTPKSSLARYLQEMRDVGLLEFKPRNRVGEYRILKK